MESLEITPLDEQVIVEKIEMPEEVKDFEGISETEEDRIGALYRVVDKGEKCRNCYGIGDIIVAFHRQDYYVPKIKLRFLHDSAVLFVVKGV